MTTTRPDLGFSTELDRFDPEEWQTEAAKPEEKAGRGPAAIKAAEVVGFPSREDVSRIRAAPIAHLCSYCFESQRAGTITAKSTVLGKYCMSCGVKGRTSPVALWSG